MLLEKLKIEDIPELLELYKELVPYNNTKEKSIDVYKEILEDDNYHLFVVKDNGVIVGSTLAVVIKSLATEGTPFLVIEDVIIKAGLRGKGIGRLMFEHIDNFAKNKNCSYSILVSSAHRKGAHKFYEAMGFKDEVVGFRKIYN